MKIFQCQGKLFLKKYDKYKYDMYRGWWLLAIMWPVFYPSIHGVYKQQVNKVSGLDYFLYFSLSLFTFTESVPKKWNGV